MQKLIIIAGPTATGKTDLGVALSERFGGEIVGADSVQVYRGFDIGSAKPTAEDLRGIRHHMIDVAEPDEVMDAAKYAAMADTCIADIAARGKVSIVVGGTGLWLRALLRGLVELPPADMEVRRRIESEPSTASLYQKLSTVDPIAAQTLHPNDRLRIVRALEVFEQTGQALGELRRNHALGAPRYHCIYMVVDLPKPILRDRIQQRTRWMLTHGWIEETQRLWERYGQRARALQSVGYAQVLSYLRNEFLYDELEEKIVQSTHRYTCRQRTWFKSVEDVTHRLASAEVMHNEVLEQISGFLGQM